MSSVCRICLAGNTRLNQVENNVLLNIYEKLINTKFNSEDARPRALCCFCYQKLLKCHTFSEMALRSEKILSDLYDRGFQVTHESITEVNPNIEQHLSVNTMQSVDIVDNTSNAGPQVNIKDEPSVDMKEEVTTEPDKRLDVESFPDHITKSELTFEEDYSDQDNDAEELFSNTHFDQSEPDGSSFTIKDEPLLNIEIKEEVTTEVDKLVEIGSSYKQSTRSRLRIKDYSDKGKDGGRSPYKVQVEKTKADDSKKTFSCNNCTKIFDMKSKLLSHIRSSHSQVKEKQYSSTKKYTETTSMIEDKTIHNQKKKLSSKWNCHICDKHFDRKSKLFCHIRTHTGEKPFTCYVCDKQFYRKSGLVNHMRTHTGDKTFVCNVCNKQYNRKCHLVTHMRTHTGTGEKPFACNLCEKQFFANINLVVHMRTHTGEKPFACHICDKQYNQKGHLDTHIRTHTGEKPFACYVCDKQFYHKSNLVTHMRTHTGEKPFECNICNKQFNRKGYLVPHMRTHTGTGFACNLCAKLFITKSNLVVHMRTHTGDKPFACIICDKKFNQKCNLVRHMRTHTAEKL